MHQTIRLSKGKRCSMALSEELELPIRLHGSNRGFIVANHVSQPTFQSILQPGLLLWRKATGYSPHIFGEAEAELPNTADPEESSPSIRACFVGITGSSTETHMRCRIRGRQTSSEFREVAKR